MLRLQRRQGFSPGRVGWRFVDAYETRLGGPCLLGHTCAEPRVVEAALVWSADEDTQPDGDCLCFFLFVVFAAGWGGGGWRLAGR